MKFPFEVKKAWGVETVLVNTELYCCKRLIITPGWQCSLHRHAIKDETFILEGGIVHISIDGEHSVVSRHRHTMRVRPGVWHRFGCHIGSHCGVSLLEISTHHDDADVERLIESREFRLEDFLNVPQPAQPQ